MNFAVLTTTHKRPLELQRAIESVRSQIYKNFVHYIVNDSPEVDYTIVEESIAANDNITYTKNSENIGKNASLNRVLEKLREIDFECYVVFLDDDDWLAPTCLQDFKEKIEQNKNINWFVSNRTLETGVNLTKNNTGKKSISYFYDYLLFKKFTGDATHCIRFSAVSDVHYPTQIKNGEEWYYFLSLHIHTKKFLFIDKIGTYTKGYSATGQNAAMQSSYKTNTKKLFKEEQTMQTIFYLSLRFLKNFRLF